MAIKIASQAELAAALSKAKGGETFVLAPGNYGAVWIKDQEFDAPVTIRSANVSDKAKFSSLTVIDSENIGFADLHVGRAMGPKEQGFGKIVSVLGSENISLTGMKFHGKIDGNPSTDGIGLYVRGSSDVSVTRSEFTDLSRGATFDESSELVIEDNRFHTLRTDGINFAQVEDVLIKDNRFSDFLPNARDHADAIQFWTKGKDEGSSDITITGNQMFQGKGYGPQGIFIADETGRLPYENIRIDNNILYGNDSYHGISVFGAKQVSITNNTAVSEFGDGRSFWININAVNGAVIQDNVTDDLLVGSKTSGVRQSGNLELRWDADARALLDLDRGANTEVADLVMPGVGYDPTGSSPSPTPTPAPSPTPTPTPTPTPDPAPMPTLKSIFGASGGGIVWGSNADEKIFGFPDTNKKLGAGTKDVLLGGGGSDLFVLGDERGVFYDDGKRGSGRGDYASIRDFSSNDRIQLAGDASDYVLKSEKFGRAGVSIYLDTDGNGKWGGNDDFLAHVSGSVIPLDLNSDYFTFG